MRTRKLLVAHDRSRPTAGNGDFLAVVFDGMIPVLFGLKSHKIFGSGMMVFVGKEIAAQDIFAKLLESGRPIRNVNETMGNLTAFVQQLQGFKIGNIITIAPKNSEPGFELVKESEVPQSDVRRLP
jgi:hypothetical protein